MILTTNLKKISVIDFFKNLVLEKFRTIVTLKKIPELNFKFHNFLVILFSGQ